MDRAHRDSTAPARSRSRRQRRGPRPADRHREPIRLTGEGVPAAIPDAPPASPVVFVSAASRARFPWLPGRVIAGSVWRGSGAERVRVDERGEAELWRCPAAHGRS